MDKIQNMQATKVDEFTISVDKIIPETTVTNTYERSFIEQQIISIQAQKDAYDAQRDAELADCQAILDAMDAQGIVAQPADPEPAISTTLSDNNITP